MTPLPSGQLARECPKPYMRGPKKKQHGLAEAGEDIQREKRSRWYECYQCSECYHLPRTQYVRHSDAQKYNLSWDKPDYIQHSSGMVGYSTSIGCNHYVQVCKVYITAKIPDGLLIGISLDARSAFFIKLCSPLGTTLLRCHVIIKQK